MAGDQARVVSETTILQEGRGADEGSALGAKPTVKAPRACEIPPCPAEKKIPELFSPFL